MSQSGYFRQPKCTAYKLPLFIRHKLVCLYDQGDKISKIQNLKIIIYTLLKYHSIL